MSLKDRAVELVLRAKNLLSRDTDQAAESVRDLGEGAEHLRDQLRGLEDQKRLVQQFQQSTRATERARQQWERAEQQVTRLAAEIRESGEASDFQRQRLAQAQRIAGQAEASYQQQAQSVTRLSEDLRAAGISTENLSDEQIRIARETAQARRAMADYNATVDQSDGSLKRFGKSLASGVVSFAKWAAAGAAAGAALSVGLLTRYTAAQAEAARQIDNTSASIGVNAQRLQELQYAFQRVGVDSDKTGDLLKDVADKIGDAYTNGGGEAKDAIDALGLSLDALIGMSPDEQLLAIANALDSLPPASQVNIMESLANDASLLLPLLRDNAAGLRELTEEANRFGVIMSPEDLERLKATNDAVERIRGRLEGLRNDLVGEVSPAVTGLADSFGGLLDDNPGLIDDLGTAFRGLIQTTQRWMEYVITNSEKVGSSLQTLVDTGQFLGNVFIGVFRGVQTAASGVLTVVAGVIAGIMTQIEFVASGLNKLGLVSDETMRGLEARAASARQGVKDLAAQTVEYGRQTLQAGADAVASFDNTGKAAKRAAAETKKSAEEQRKANEAIINSAKEISQEADNYAQRQKELREEIRATELELARYQTRMAQDPSPEYAQKVQQLESQLAGLKLELQGVTQAADSNTKAMEAAAEAIGLTLDELKTGVSDSAAAAIEGFEQLARSGELTGEQMQDAFQATWEKLDSPEAREAFLANLKEMADEGVDGAARWLRAYQAAFEGIEKGSEGTVDALKKVKEAAKEASESQEDNARASRSMSLSLEQIQGAAARAAGTVRSAWKALARQAREAAAAESAAAESSRDHASAVDEQTRAMQRAEQASSSLNDSLEASIAGMREQLAQLEGDQARVQELQYDRQRLEFQQKLNEAREAGDAEAQGSAREAMRLADEIHQKRLANLREEARERERQVVDEVRAEQRRATATPATPSTTAARSPAPAQSTQRVEIAIKSDTGTATVYADSQSEADRFLEALGRDAKRVH